MEEISCIFCHKSIDLIAIEESGYKGRKCHECGLIFISPRPIPSEIKDIYSHDQAHASAESHIRAKFMKTVYAKHNLAIIKKFINKRDMLEIGVGAGRFLNTARENGFSVHGIELNKIQAEFVKNKLKIPCETSALTKDSFGVKQFDVICHFDVASHFYDPISEFKKMNDKLKEGGILFFETGNAGDIKEKYYKLFTSFQYPDHLFFFGEKSLRILLEQTGFEIIKIYRYSLLPQLLYQKILLKVIKFIERENKPTAQKEENISKTSDTTVSPSHGILPKLKRFLGISAAYVKYLIRYKGGYVMPKKERPQTVIVVARKTTPNTKISLQKFR